MRAAWFALFLGSFVSAGSARADIPWSAGDLVCDGVAALARFTKGYNDDTPKYEALPAEVDRAGLSATLGADRRDCTLSNGWEVRLRMGSEQGFAYGMGGAAPSEYFSLWVNRRKVISRKIWFHGYEQSFDDQDRIVGVLITESSITICKRSDAKVACERSAIVVARMEPDQVEFPPPGIIVPKAGSIRITQGRGNRLCRQMVRTGRPANIVSPNSIWSFPLSARPIDFGEVDWIDPSPMTPIETHSWPLMKGGRIGELSLDPSRRQTAVSFSFASRSFDGSYWVVLDKGVRLRDVEHQIFQDSDGDDIEKPSSMGGPKLWHSFSGGTPQLYPNVSPRYVHLDAYTYRGRVYFLTHPTLLTHDPTAVLVRPRPRGDVEIVCSFQVVRPNF